MRERLAKDKDATYTYSLDYVSQTVNLVDEVCERKEEKVGNLPEYPCDTCLRQRFEVEGIRVCLLM